MRAITDRLVRDLAPLGFSAPVTHVYNPLVYARAPWEQYCDRYGRGQPEALLVGMNPGPFGMAQTGVPFGEVSHARDWLGVAAAVGRPENEHPKRPIEGFACTRSEVSGARLWGWAKAAHETPDAFFARFFVTNYCPLVFMSASGANITPDKLPRHEREPLFAACDRALLATIERFRPRIVIGVGAFAEARATAVLTGSTRHVEVGRVPHPSPASPAANAGWSRLMDEALARLGLGA
jgi:single-strand selective monofunctional uracil DNA glycosylase